MTPAKKIMILAGEASGDLYGAHLVRAIKTLQPDTTFFGMGGSQMQAAGVDIKVDSAQVSVVGVAEVFAQLNVILRAAKTLKTLLKTQRPDLLILIDFPDFNLHIAKFAKKLNIKIFYYISPQIWAWRKSRIHTIKKRVDKIAVILPFEEAIYKKAGVPVCFAGHPLIDIAQATHTKAMLLENFNLTAAKPLIGLLPGSRHQEIERLLPVMLEAATLLYKDYPHAQFVLPLAPSICAETLAAYLQETTLPLQVIAQQTYELLSICDVIITASGTLTLEATLLHTPMVIIYKLKNLSFRLGKWLIKLAYIGLPNLIANKRIVPELIQEDANAVAIYQEVKKILDDSHYRQQMQQALATVAASLGTPGANQRIAAAALDVIDNK